MGVKEFSTILAFLVIGSGPALLAFGLIGYFVPADTQGLLAQFYQDKCYLYFNFSCHGTNSTQECQDLCYSLSEEHYFLSRDQAIIAISVGAGLTCLCLIAAVSLVLGFWWKRKQEDRVNQESIDNLCDLEDQHYSKNECL